MKLVECKTCHNLYRDDRNRCTICNTFSNKSKSRLYRSIENYLNKPPKLKPKMVPVQITQEPKKNFGISIIIAFTSIIFFLEMIKGNNTVSKQEVEKSNTPKYHNNIDFNRSDHIIKTTTFGCVDEDVYRQIIGYIKDQEAFKKAIIVAKINGICDMFYGGEKVYFGSLKSKNSFFSISLPLISVRRKGSIHEYWIYSKDIDDNSSSESVDSIEGRTKM